jgi:oxalate decarboxylase/phosphoglucose isomerase-like protein (cupin superfamily)
MDDVSRREALKLASAAGLAVAVASGVSAADEFKGGQGGLTKGNHFALESSKPVIDIEGKGKLYRANKDNFSALAGLAVQTLKLEKGSVREPHMHPNANQLDYCITGTARVGIVGPGNYKQYLDLKPGDISFVPQGYLHWIENTGEGPLHFQVVLSHERPETIEISEMLSGVPKETLAKVYGIPAEVFQKIPNKTIVIGGKGAL